MFPCCQMFIAINVDAVKLEIKHFVFNFVSVKSALIFPLIFLVIFTMCLKYVS